MIYGVTFTSPQLHYVFFHIRTLARSIPVIATLPGSTGQQFTCVERYLVLNLHLYAGIHMYVPNSIYIHVYAYVFTEKIYFGFRFIFELITRLV